MLIKGLSFVFTIQVQCDTHYVTAPIYPNTFVIVSTEWGTMYDYIVAKSLWCKEFIEDCAHIFVQE